MTNSFALRLLAIEHWSFTQSVPSLWCSPENMPASHAGDHRSEAGQGRQFSARGSRGTADPPDSESGSLGRASRLAPTNFIALKAFSAMHSLGKRISSVQFRVGAPFSQPSQRSSGFHKPAVSGAAPETATISCLDADAGGFLL